MTVTITVLATTPRIHEQQAIGLKSKKQSADCYLTTGVSRAEIFRPLGSWMRKQAESIGQGLAIRYRIFSVH